MTFLKQISSKIASVKTVLRSKKHLLISFQKDGERMVASSNMTIEEYNKAIIDGKEIIDEVLNKNK